MHLGVGRHAPVAARGEAHEADLRAVGHAGALELLAEETPVELLEPLEDSGLVEGHVRVLHDVLPGADVGSVLGLAEGAAGQMEDFHRGIAVPHEVVDEEIVQFVWADKVFCLLLDLSL